MITFLFFAIIQLKIKPASDKSLLNNQTSNDEPLGCQIQTNPAVQHIYGIIPGSELQQ